MNILHLITRIENSGPNKVMINLAQGQAALGAKVEVASLQPERDTPALVADLRAGGVVTHAIRGGGPIATIRAVRALSLRHDITHVHCLRSLSIAMAARSRKLVATSHMIPDEDWPLTKGRLRGAALAALHYRLLARTDKVAAINERMRQRICARGGDVVLLRNPVALPAAPNTPSNAPLRRLLCVGHLNSRKNQALLLDALAQLGPQAATIQLDLLGDGPLRPALEAQARELSATVHFAGHVADPNPWFRQAQLYVSPALSEGQPIAVLEALGHGVPCLLSDISGHALPGAPEGSVAHFPPDAAQLAQALAALTRGPARCPPGAIATWTRDMFAPTAVAAQYLSLYQSLLEESP